MTYHHLSHGRFRASIYASHKHTTQYKLIEDFSARDGVVFPKNTLVEFSNALVTIPTKDVIRRDITEQIVYKEKRKRRNKSWKNDIYEYNPTKEFIPRGRGIKPNHFKFGMTDNMVRHLNGNQPEPV